MMRSIFFIFFASISVFNALQPWGNEATWHSYFDALLWAQAAFWALVAVRAAIRETMEGSK